MNKPISRAVLKTELSVAMQYIDEANYGLVSEMVGRVLERVGEYDLTPACPHLDNVGCCKKSVGHKKCTCKAGGRFA